MGFSGLVLGAAVVGYNLQASEPAATETAQATSEITVYKSPSCSCCADWAEHLENNGFTVQVETVDDLRAIKSQYEVPREMASCHTAVIDGLVVEGHVPAGDIKAYVANPNAGFGDETVGLSVPGMPHGTPGMETGRQDSYAVLAFTADGDTETVKSYGNY
tara:strand:+ start:1209 stop:1691 length:483 start_codon:yes stop_codon:yes gene_type:complete